MNEVYGNLSIVVSRTTNQQNKDDAIYESQCKFGDHNIEELIADYFKQLGITVHNASVEWENYYNDEDDEDEC